MKLHPLSIPLRAITRFNLRSLLPILVLGFAGGSQSSSQPFGAYGIGFAAGLFVLIFVAGVVRNALYYQRFEYDLTEDTFDISSGVLSRRERTIPIRRIQNVDISEDPLARLVGLAAVSLETAGGGSDDAEGELRYVARDEAERVQNEIQRLKRSHTEDDETEPKPTTGSASEADATTEQVTTDEPTTADETLFSLSMRNLLLASVLSLDLRPLLPVVIVVLEGARYVPGALAEAIVGNPGVGAIVVAVVSVAASAGSTFIRYYDFRLWRSGDELRYERGLFSRYTGSIPLEKIQNLIVSENVLERRFGYASLDVETAGYGSRSAASRGSESVVPIAGRGAVLDFARSIDGFDFGELDFSQPPKRARRRYAGRYVIAIGVLTGALFAANAVLDVEVLGWWFAPLALLVAVPFAAHYKWLHRGVRTVEGHVLTQNGFWRRSTEIVPYYRVQTIMEDHTVFQRRWNLATLVLDTAGSRNLSHQGARAVDFDAEAARDLRETVRRRLRRSVIQRRRDRRRTPTG